MARTVNEIFNQMISNKETYSELSPLTSNSQVSKWRLFYYVAAVSISILEQILDIFKLDIETKVANKVSGTKEWIKTQLLAFQYSSTTPQIVEIDSDFNITYPTVDTTLQIIKQVATEVQTNNVVLIKIAKNSPPEPLDANEIAAVQTYLDEIMPAGINTRVISEDSDKIMIKGNIYYNGLYSSTIKANVELAITSYLENLPFGGRYVQSELETAILAVSGVKDVNLTRVQVRKAATTFVYGSNTSIYILEGTTNDVNNRYYDSYAGYIETETTASYTISDTLTYIIQ